MEKIMVTDFDKPADNEPSGGYARCPRCKNVFAPEQFGYRRRREPSGLCPICADDARDYSDEDDPWAEDN